jgi:hypothetical protein
VAIPAERLGANDVRHLERLTILKANCVAKGPLSAVTNVPPRQIIQRDDGRFAIGLTDDAPGPFETRRFAEAIAGRGVRHARTT